MFERYTEKARRVIFFARYEASRLGSPQIEPEHILLGLVREEAPLLAWVRQTDPDSIRRRIDGYSPNRPSTSTSVDMPLSTAGKRVLDRAADEASRLASKKIGSEHLLLALVQEEGSFAAKLLLEGGADAATIRAHYDERDHFPPPSSSRASNVDPGFRRVSYETVEIRGSRWNVDSIRDVIALCRSYNWHWSKVKWKPRNIVIHRKSGRLSFDFDLLADTENFELSELGLKKGHCLVCRWEFFESEDEHGTGYTNGHDWLCTECCERFLQNPNFFSSSQSEMT